MALVPLASVFLFFVLFWVTRPFMQRAIEAASAAGAKRHEFFIDFLTSFRAVKLSGYSDLWSQRFREISSDTVVKSYAIVRISAVINTGTQFLVSMTGLATMTVGIFKVLNNEMSSGALMASILLVWRVLAPLRSGFGVLNQIGKIQLSIKQVDRLMTMSLEKAQESKQEFKKEIEGSVKVSQVSMRYSVDSNPALLGVSFEVPKGETLVITGSDGTGKTTILKLLLGLFRPQAGRLIIGNMNVRQLDPIILRHSIAYAPQDNEIFDGTVAENLLLAKPEATDQELEKAAEAAGILGDIEKMENSFNTAINSNSAALDRSFVKGLGLAQMFLCQSSLYLIDEPEKGLDNERLKIVLSELDKIKENATLIIVTKSSEILKKADQILWLENNRVKLYGSAKEVLKGQGQQLLDAN
ncbi:MAG: ATP-binding cassette domain-containing protein [SAR324 cluster bacterium]|nr:ATP-binding cassette domain-containing protein [SAR324 cluster bacterium]